MICSPPLLVSSPQMRIIQRSRYLTSALAFLKCASSAFNASITRGRATHTEARGREEYEHFEEIDARDKVD